MIILYYLRNEFNIIFIQYKMVWGSLHFIDRTAKTWNVIIQLPGRFVNRDDI